MLSPFFFFIDTSPTEIYTLSLHDALPILTLTTSSPVSLHSLLGNHPGTEALKTGRVSSPLVTFDFADVKRSEEHTSELQSRRDIVCRLLLEKKNCSNKTRRH